MLTLHSAERFEPLREALLARLMQPGGSPFEREPVLVPSTAIRRHLALAIADRHGVCAQVEFSFLAQWLWQQIGRAVPGVPERSPFDPPVLRWRIDACLVDGGFVASHPRLAGWLATADAAMRFSLADRLAHLFDAYLTWRPDWLAAWSAGALRATAADAGAARADEHWQADLWRRLQRAVEGTGSARDLLRHPAEQMLALLAEDTAAIRLPRRVHVFCPPGMPPLYLQILSGLAAHAEIELYILNPCREYWLDLVSQRSQARARLAGRDAHLEVGHRLLAAWGRQTQSWLQLLLDQDGELLLDDVDAADPPRPADRPATLLHQLQEGIRTLHDLAPGALAGVVPDGSLEVHVCHARLRELEVLQDRLLARFAGPAAPEPADILVVVPDLEETAALIDQVFGTAPRPRHIPYAIVGLAPAQGNPLARSLFRLLDLIRSRLPLSGLIDLLQDVRIATRFELAPADVDQLAVLLRSAGVHWGFDAAHRASLGLPAEPRGTLSDGLERLWLGHVLPDAPPEPWQDHLPAQACEGSQVALLGLLARVVGELGWLRQQLAVDLTPEGWCSVLEAAIERFLQVPATLVEAHAALLSGLRAHAAELAEGKAGPRVPVEVLLAALRDRFDAAPHGGAASGALTFASLSSLRGLPHRVVCILGLDDGVFPTVTRPPEFDLMAAYPRRGDRQRGEDDRNLFLDLLMAARDGLHLSYCGRSARDNTILPPSVLLDELLDALVPALCPADADAAALASVRRRLVCEHPLQPFDADYFQPGGSRLPHSFRADLAAALRGGKGAASDLDRTRAQAALAAAPLDDNGEEGGSGDEDAFELPLGAPAFFIGALPPLEPDWRRLELGRLIAFLQHPARALLRERLGLRLPERAQRWDDSEDFLPDREAAGALAARLLPRLRAAEPDAVTLWRDARAGDEFPRGVAGDLALRRELDLLCRFAAEVRALHAVAEAPARVAELGVRVEDETWLVQGTLPGLRGHVQVGAGYADRHAREELAIWLRHLWACAHHDPVAGPTPETRWCLRSGPLVLRGLARDVARAHLQDLVALYDAGMRQPVHFYPRSARRFAEGARPQKVLDAWRGVWPDGRGERHDPAWQLVLRGVAQPLDGEFETLAVRVFAPMLACLR